MDIKIGEQIAYLRKQRGLTQEGLARTLGVTNQSVSKWEAGACCPDIQLLPDIAVYFEVTVDELLGRPAEETFSDVYHRTKRLFRQASEDEVFSLTFRLAALLHEAALSKGYKRHLPWDDTKEFGLTTPPTPWGVSISSEPEGETIHAGGSVFFSDMACWEPMRAADVRSIGVLLERLSGYAVLRMLFTLFERTEEKGRYVPAEELAEAAGLSVEDTADALSHLPVDIGETADGRPGYRLEGRYRHLPPLLRLLRER